MDALTSLLRGGKLGLPCGVFAVTGPAGAGWALEGPRGLRAVLTVVAAGVAGHPGAVGFRVHNRRDLRSLGAYAALADGTVVRCG